MWSPCTVAPASRHQLWQTLQHWVLWNSFVEAVAEESVAVEALDERAVSRLARLAELPLPRRPPGELDAMLLRISTRTNSHHTRKPNQTLTWAQLGDVDVEFAAMAQLMAMRWGYAVAPDELLPPLAGDPAGWPQQLCALNEADRWQCGLGT